MIIIVLVLVTCHTPDRVVQILRWLPPIAGDVRPTRASCPAPLFYIANISNLLIVFNSSTNFVIYCAFRRRFRQILFWKLCSFRSRNSLGGSSTRFGSGRAEGGTVRQAVWRGRNLLMAGAVSPRMIAAAGGGTSLMTGSYKETTFIQHHESLRVLSVRLTPKSCSSAHTANPPVASNTCCEITQSRKGRHW